MRNRVALWTSVLSCFCLNLQAEFPQISLDGETSSRVPLGSAYEEITATATDAEDGNITDITITYEYAKGITRRGDMAAWWRFEDNAEDETTNGNDGTLVNDPTFVEGKFGQALNMPHDGSYMAFTDFNGVDNSSALSISAWILPNSLEGGATADGAIFSTNNNDGSTVLYWVNFDAASAAGPASFTYNVGATNGTGNRLNGTANALHALDWQHVVGVMDGNERKLYVDGVLNASLTNAVTTTITLEGQSGRVGSWTTTNNMNFDGKIDDLRVYSVALTDEDVSKIYGDAGAGDLNALDADTVDTNLVGLWTVTFSATDADGNTTTAVRTVDVFDPDAPVIKLIGGAQIQLEQGTEFVDPGHTIEVGSTNELIPDAEATITGSVDHMTAGVYTLSYNYTDAEDRDAATVTREVTVADTTAPEINLVGGATMQHLVGEPFIDPGAVATDTVDGEFPAQSSLWIPNQLIHRGFYPGWPETELNFNNNEGLIPDTPRGEKLLTSELNFGNDADFRAAGVGINQNDNFRNLFIGYFFARKAGEYEFGIQREDDRATLWLDLDQDDVFELDGDDGNEWINGTYNAGYGTVTLEPGFYRFAVGHLEGGGGSSVEVRFKTPEGAGPTTRTIVNPGAAEQEDLWLTSNPLPTHQTGTYTITYIAKDGAGNSTTVSRTVEVVDTIAKPALTLIGRPIIQHPAGTDYTDEGVTLKSSTGEDLDAALVIVSGAVDTAVLGTYELVYSYVDGNGIAADQVTRTVNVRDAVAPTITLEGDAEMELILGQPFLDPGVTVSDNFESGLVAGSTEKLPTNSLWMHLDASNIPGVAPGDTLLQWTDISGNGNHLTDVRGETILVADALNGKPAVRVDGDDFLAATAQVQRRYSVFTVSQLEGSDNERLISSRDINWLLGYHGGRVDRFHPEAWSVQLKSRPADIAPHLYSATSTGSNQVRFFSNGREIIEVSSVNGRIGKFQIGGYQDSLEGAAGDVAEVLIYDNYVVTEAERLSVEALLSIKYDFPGYPEHTPPDLTQLGEHEILYVAQDSSGNLGFATRKVTVIPDPALPIIVLEGDAEMMVEGGSTFTDPGTKITDGEGNEVNGEAATPTGTVDTSVLGLHTITYTYSEPGADALPAERRVIVVDTLPPVITLTGDSDVRVKVGEEFSDPGVSALDQFEGDVVVSISHNKPVEGYLPGLLGGGMAGNVNTTAPNPGNYGIDPIGPTAAYSNNGPLWKTNWTIVYSGQVYDEDGKMGFLENIDDKARLTINGQQVLSNDSWNTETTGSVNFGEGGWFDIEFRMGNGAGGAGLVGNIGFGIDPEDDGTFVQAKNSDAQTMDVFRAWGLDYSRFDTSEPGSFTIEYTAVDQQGNTSTEIRNVVIVEDDTVPYIVLNGEVDMTLEADPNGIFTDPKAVVKDADGNDLVTDLAGEGDTVDLTTPGTYQLVYRHTTGDDQVLEPVKRTIHVVDSIPPVITLLGESTVTIFVNSAYSDAGATASDTLDGAIDVFSDLDRIPNALLHNAYHTTHSTTLLDFDNNGGLFERDPAGSQLFRWGDQQRGIDLLDDTQFRRTHSGLRSNDNFQNLFYGYFTALRDGEYEFQIANINDSGTIWLDKDQDGVFERLGDNGDEQVIFGNQTNPVFLLQGDYRVAVGHSESTGTSGITARFRTPGGAGPETLTAIKPADPSQAGVWSTIPNAVDTSVPGRYKVNFYSYDAAGNATTVSRTIIVEEDLERPVITLVGDTTLTHEAGFPFVEPGYVLDDYQGNSLDETEVVVTGAPDGMSTGTFTIRYDFTDPDGHVADTRTRLVTVEDTIGPNISVLGANPITVQLGATFVDPGAVAIDKNEGELRAISTAQFIYEGLVLHLDADSFAATLQDGEEITTDWPDLSGEENHADNRSGNPTWVAASTHGKPAVNFDGDDLIWTTRNFQPLLANYSIFTVGRHTGGDSERVFSSRNRNWLFGFYGNKDRAFHSDGWVLNAGSANTIWHIHTGTVNDSDQANFWHNNAKVATNSTGLNNVSYMPREFQMGGYNTNTQMSKCEVSEVLIYNRVLSGSEIYALQQHLNEKYGLNGGGNFSFTTIDTSQEGEHTIRYLAEDSAGHQSETTRTVIVVDEPNLPVIVLNGDAQVTHSAGDPYIDAGAIIQDAQNGEEPIMSGNVDVLTPGTYTLTYDFADQDGNTATTVIRNVTVVDDSAPVITLVGGDTIEQQLGNPFMDPGFSAEDAVDGEVNVDSSALTLDRLVAKGFLLNNSDVHLDLANEGGMLAQTPVGQTTFVTSREKVGVYFDDDWDFRTLIPEINRNDNFQFMVEGHFHTSTGGRYEFGIENPDDRGGLWLDLDKDGIFEDNGDFGPEFMNPGWTYGYRQVDLTPGYYRFAVVHREGSGGSRIDPRYRAISGEGPSTRSRIYPGTTQQKGQWVIYKPINVLVPGEHIITYTATDAAGNTSSVTRTIIVKNNPDAAILNLEGEAEMTLGLNNDFTDPGVSITDLDGNAIAGAEPVVTGEVDVTRPGLYSLNYNYTNTQDVPSRQVSRKVRVVDDMPPVLTLIGDAEITIFQGSVFDDPGAVAVDDYDGNLPVGSSEILPAEGLVLHLDASQIVGKADGDEVRLWYDVSGSANDANIVAGTPLFRADAINGQPAVHFDGFSRLATSTDFSQTYSIITVSRLAGGSNQRLLSSLNRNWLLGYQAGFEDVFHPENHWATDRIQAATTTPHIYSATSGNWQVNFFADGRDLTAFPQRRDDNYRIGQFQMGAYLDGDEPSVGDVAEVILYNRILSNTDRMSIEARLNAKYSLNGVNDAVAPVNTNKLGTYHVIYQAVDGAGNLSSVKRTVIVAPDPNSPVISLIGDSHISHEAGTDYTDPGATLQDAEGNTLDATKITVVNPVDSQVPGLYVITYNYQPEFESHASEVKRTVVVEDTLPPVLTLTGDKIVKLEIGETYVEEGATASDVFNGDVYVINDHQILTGQIDRRGYKESPSNDALLDLDGNGGLLAETPAGYGIMINGPGNRGLDFDNRTDFWSGLTDLNGDPTPEQADNFQMLFTGYFIARVNGTYEFGIADQDDRTSLWLDKDQDGTFEDNGDNGNEQLRTAGQGGYQTTYLDAGIYQFAFAYREGGGSERTDIRYSRPSYPSPLSRQRIRPGLSSQAFDWGVLKTEELDTSVAGTHVITYTAMDAFGHVTTTTRTVIVVEDATLPFISLNGEFEVEHEAGTAYTDLNAVVKDAADAVLQAELVGVSNVDVNVPGEYTVTFNYTDGTSGKVAEEVVRKVIVVDTTPPEVTLKVHPEYGGTDTVTFMVGNPWVDPGIDISDIDPEAWFITSRDFIPNQLYHAGFVIDHSGNNANFENEGGLLSMTPNGSTFFTKGGRDQGFDYDSDADFRREPIGITRNDDFASYISGYFYARVAGDYTFDSDKHDDDLAIWLDLDQDGHFSRNNLNGDDERLTFDTANRVVNLSPGYYRFAGVHSHDNGTAKGRLRIQTPEGAGPSDALTAIKPADPAQAGIWNLMGDGEIDPTFPGTYTITYFAFDKEGHVTTATRTVIIEEDPDAPILTLAGDAEIQHQVGTVYNDQLPTISKADGTNIDDQGNIDSTVTLDGAPVSGVEGNNAGVYEIQYDYTDGNSRKAVPIYRTVIVGDYIPPVITVLGEDPFQLPPGFDYTDAGATAEDDVDGPVTVTASGDVINTAAEATHTVTYTATDAVGNTATATRTVIVKDDLNRPIITLVEGYAITHEAGEPFVDPGATVVNGRGITFDATDIIVVGDVDHTLLGDYTLTYDYSKDGKTAPRVTRTVTVEDTTAPEIELTDGEKVRIAVGSTWLEPGYTVTDNHDPNPMVKVIFETTGTKPVAHWSFDETDGTVAKELMNGLDGTLLSFPDPVADSWVAGKYGNALKFEAANSSLVTVPPSDKLDLQSFTISAWVSTGDYNQSMFLFEKTTDNTINSQYNLYFDNDETLNFKTFGIDISTNNIQAPSVANLTINQWQHVAVTYDGENKLIYLNAELVGTGTHEAELNTNPSGPAYIGAFAPGDGYFFNGLIDDLKIYDLPIPESQIPEIQKRSGIDTSEIRKDPYVLSYSSTDTSGNTSQVVRKIVVSNDTTPPEIILNGAAEIQLDVGDTYTEQGATATDNQDLDVISAMIQVNGTVDTSKEGTYLITYDVEDLSFNAADQVVRTITVGTPSETDNLPKWVTDHLSGFPTDQHQELDDPDNDQLENLAEYALGGNPAQSDAAEFLPFVHESGGKLTLTFLRLKSSVDSKISYRVELSTSLSTPNWSDTAVDVTLHGDQNGVPADYEKVNATAKTAIADETEGKQFIRIVIDRD